MSNPLFSDEKMAQVVIENAAEYGNPRCAIAEKALSGVGLSWATNADRFTEFLFLEGINEPITPQLRQQARGFASAMSTCAIFTRACWRYAGVDAPFLYDFYAKHIGKCLGQEMQFAQKVGAWRSGIPWQKGTPFPECGDAIIVGDNTAAFGRGSILYQHEGNVMGWIEGPRGALAVCIDGGQPGIEFVLRGFVELPGELWVSRVAPDGSLPLGSDGRPLEGRRVVGYTDVSALPYRPGMPPSCKNAGWGDLLKWGLAGAAVAGAALVGLGVVKV